MLGEYLDEFIIVYLDNIIIYSKIKKEYYKYVKWVLQRLINEKMLIAIKKYVFHTTKTEFYGFIIICSCLMSNVVPIKVHIDYCRDIDTKNLQGEHEW